MEYDSTKYLIKNVVSVGPLNGLVLSANNCNKPLPEPVLTTISDAMPGNCELINRVTLFCLFSSILSSWKGNHNFVK